MTESFLDITTVNSTMTLSEHLAKKTNKMYAILYIVWWKWLMKCFKTSHHCTLVVLLHRRNEIDSETQTHFHTNLSLLK